MQNNSNEVVLYLGKNLNTLIKRFSRKGTVEEIEDACQKLAFYLIRKPRFIPHIQAWIQIAMDRLLYHARVYKQRFTYEDSGIFEQLISEVNFSVELEKAAEVKYKLNKINEVVKTTLTKAQEEAIEAFIKLDGSHDSELKKVHYHKAINKLRKILDSKLYASKKYDSKKMVERRGYGLKKRGAKVGAKRNVVNKLGRKSAVTNEHKESLNKKVIIIDGYVVNMAELEKLVNLSRCTITKVLKELKPELRVSRKKTFSLEFLQNEAKKYTSKTKWQLAAPGQYQRARRMNWLDECCKHMAK